MQHAFGMNFHVSPRVVRKFLEVFLLMQFHTRIKISLVFELLLLLLAGLVPAGYAAENIPAEPYQGAMLCLPQGMQRPVNGDCLLAGPAAYQARLAAQGIHLPLRPLPAISVDPALAYVPYLYGLVRIKRAPVYASLEDARKEAARRAVRRLEVGPRGLTYISYQDQVVEDGKRYYMVSPGQWMTANDVSRISPARFSGLIFMATPHNDFGWVLQTAVPQRTPGVGGEPLPDKTLYRYEVVQVYNCQTVDGVTWLLIGPDRWVEDRLVGVVHVNPVPPEGVDNGRWVEVNLEQQTLSVYENGQLRFATLVATGVAPYWTRPGLFQIYALLETETMRGVFEADRSDYYYLEDVPWTMYFDEARALHGTYWHNGFGYPRSHGCVNMSLADAHWVFNWAQEGDWVYVWDPSGQTPESPDAYTGGGA